MVKNTTSDVEMKDVSSPSATNAETKDEKQEETKKDPELLTLEGNV